MDLQALENAFDNVRTAYIESVALKIQKNISKQFKIPPDFKIMARRRRNDLKLFVQTLEASKDIKYNFKEKKILYSSLVELWLYIQLDSVPAISWRLWIKSSSTKHESCYIPVTNLE